MSSTSRGRKSRKPQRKYATRKRKNEPSTLAGIWFRCSDEQYASFESAATGEGFKWVNRWAMMHLVGVYRLGESIAYSFPETGKPADHVQPWDREGTGIWIDAPGHFDEFTRQATVEGFRTVLDWGLHHLKQIVEHGKTAVVKQQPANAA